MLKERVLKITDTRSLSENLIHCVVRQGLGAVVGLVKYVVMHAVSFVVGMLGGILILIFAGVLKSLADHIIHYILLFLGHRVDNILNSLILTGHVVLLVIVF